MSFKNLIQLLNQRFTDSPTWSQLATSTQEVLNSFVGTGTDELKKIRDPILYRKGQTIDTSYGFGKITTVVSESSDGTEPDNIYVEVPNVGTVLVPISRFQDRTYLQLNAGQLGFNFFPSNTATDPLSTTLTNADYARMVQYISMYWPESGATQAFQQFIGFIQSINVQIWQLWAPNDGADTYTKLATFNEDPINGTIPVWKGGTWYPTSSVQVLYDIFDGTISLPEIQSLFFTLAPIHLVLSRLSGLAQAYFNLNAIVVGSSDTFENGTNYQDFTNCNNTFASSLIKGGSSQRILYSNPTRTSFQIQNTSTGSLLWICELGAATLSQPSIAVWPGQMYTAPVSGIWSGEWYVNGPVTGQTFTVIERSQFGAIS